MTAKLIDGKALAAETREQVARRAATLRERGRSPILAAVRVGDDSAAASYARSQAKHADAVGIDYRLVELPEGTTPSEAARAVEELNADSAVSGIMLHLPVPKPLDGFALQQLIAPGKDVEGVGAANLGMLAMGREALVPCTAAAAFACLKSTGIDLTGREAVVIGRSTIVGKPLAMLLLAAHATVTQCHTRTRDLPQHTCRAEVLIVSAGAAGLIGAEHVSPGAVVIDVGTNRVPASDAPDETKMKTIGDVRFDEVFPIAEAITPVPGGVGPVTVAMLLSNTVDACERVSRD
ncbi:MAG: bifunctional 5,10-methylenetetrahydrofolate dehydrogenase/5,10-methenyltetrahydrofolate cyclohydrolase [Phycisphaerales bacterium]|nr:bifunctional 5,10-methylenetetrahydrofolate dehydrogenase/5,10-methenyltetrahydrofolate cyclohydrolase [Phycisphaerales bacterium]